MLSRRQRSKRRSSSGCLVGRESQCLLLFSGDCLYCLSRLAWCRILVVEDMGHVGERLLDLIVLGSAQASRPKIAMSNLPVHAEEHICKPADALERSANGEDEYHIHGFTTNRFIRSKDMGNLTALLSSLVSFGAYYAQGLRQLSPRIRCC